MTNQPNQEPAGDGASAQESTHHLIETRLAKMAELGEQVPLYPYAYDRSHVSTELRQQEETLTAEET